MYIHIFSKFILSFYNDLNFSFWVFVLRSIFSDVNNHPAVVLVPVFMECLHHSFAIVLMCLPHNACCFHIIFIMIPSWDFPGNCVQKPFLTNGVSFIKKKKHSRAFPCQMLPCSGTYVRKEMSRDITKFYGIILDILFCTVLWRECLLRQHIQFTATYSSGAHRQLPPQVLKLNTISLKIILN